MIASRSVHVRLALLAAAALLLVGWTSTPLTSAALDDARALHSQAAGNAVGSDALNLALSQRRADAVRDALVGRGVDGVRISAQGLGKDRPVASNDPAAGRQRNRRVEIVVSSTR